MERRARVFVACVLFTAALLIGNGKSLMGAWTAAPQGDAPAPAAWLVATR